MSSVVVLDACVLFPFTLRDTLLSIAENGLYEVRWTNEILEEARRNLVKTGQITQDKSQRLIEQMKTVFEDALVTNYTPWISSMTNDLKDRHVAAAGVACKAQIIVTFNLRHFPSSALSPFQIQVQSPDAFLCSLLSENLKLIQQIMQNQAREYHQPPMTLAELLNILAKQTPRFAERLRQSFNLRY